MLYGIKDTNGIIFRALPAVLGVSVKNKFAVNSVCVPRTPGEAVGGICKLVHTDGREVTVNVEYNQLDPLLKSSKAFPNGDVADSHTGCSPFPGIYVCKLISLCACVRARARACVRVDEMGKTS
jgi:UDP-sugar pyrophosphorylase